MEPTDTPEPIPTFEERERRLLVGEAIPPVERPVANVNANSRLLLTAVITGLIVTVLGTVSLVLLLSQQTAVDALGKSSQRSECRTQIKNDHDDLAVVSITGFQGDIARVLDASVKGDEARASAIVEEMVAKAKRDAELPSTQEIIEDVCPPPLKAVPRYTAPTTASPPTTAAP